MILKNLFGITSKKDIVNAIGELKEAVINEAVAEGVSAAATDADTIAKNKNTEAIYANIKAVLKWLVTTPQGWATIAAGAAVATVAVIAYNNSVDGMIKKNQKLIDSNKEVYNSILEEEKELINSTNNLKELYNDYLAATKGSEEYYNVVNKIAELSPELVIGYDNEGNAILANNDAIKAQIEYYKQLAEEKRNAAKNEALENLGEETNSYQKLKGKKESVQERYNKSKSTLDEYKKIIKRAENGDTLSEEELLFYNEAVTNIETQKLAVEGLREDLKDLSNQALTSAESLRTYYTALLDTVDYELTDVQKSLRQGLLDYAVENNVNHDDFKELEKLFMNNGIVQNAAKEILSLDENLTDKEYRQQALVIYNKLANAFELTDQQEQAFKVTFGIDDESIANAAETRTNNFEAINNKITDSELNKARSEEIKEWANSLSDEDLQIVANLVFDKNATKDSLEKALNEAKGIIESVDLSLGKTKSEMIDLINSMSDGFDVLDEVYADVVDKGSFDFTKLDSKKFEEAFKDLKGEYEEFIETVSSSPTDIKACQEAFDKLATAYIDSKGILEGLTEENSNVAISMLKNMGIANAEEIVMAQLAYQTEMLTLEKQFCEKEGYELADATYAEVVELINEVEISEEAKQALAQLALTKIDVNENKIDTSDDIDQIISLANAANASKNAIQKLVNAKAILANVESAGGDIRKAGVSSWEYNDALKAIEEINNGTFDYEVELLDPNDFKVTSSNKYSPKYSGADKTKDALEKAAGSAKEEFKETFDFFERRVKVLEDAFANLEAGIENVLGADAKNTLLSQQLAILDEEVNNYTDALNMYKEKADEALSGLDKNLQEKIVNGEISLIDFNGEGNQEVVEAMQAYEGWADKVAECTQKLQELQKQIRELELAKFNNIVDDFTDQFDLRENSKELIDAQIGLLEESGELVGEAYYSQQIAQSQKQLEILETQKAAMVKQLSEAIASGRIQKGTDEWYEMVTSINDVEASILDAKTSIEEFENSILELDWSNFERLQTALGEISTELGNLAGLFDDVNEINVSDGKGNWTAEAITTLGLHAQEYENAQLRVQQYGEAIEKLEADYADGKYSTTEYMDKLAELTQGQWDAVDAMHSAEDAIISLNETRINEEIETINEEIEAYQELIDKQIELIDETEKLKDKQEDLAEKSKSVADIEKQLAAIMYDNSAAGIAKRKLLEQELADAKKELSDAEHDYSIEAQKDALNKQAEDYEESRNNEIEQLEESLKDRETIISNSFETVKQNASLVGEQILITAQKHGVKVSNEVITPWANGEKAIASYGETLTIKSSAFINTLMEVEAEIYKLQTDANVTSEAIASMFGNKADTLVTELTASYSSIENLNNVTNLLQQSMVDTLERGYDISGITSGLKSIADAANDAANAFRDMHTAANSGGTYVPASSTYGTGNPYKSVEDHAQKTDKASQTLHGYSVVDKVTGYAVRSGFKTKQEAQEYLDKYGVGGRYKIKAYAKGGIVSKEDDGVLNSVAKSVGEDTMIAVKYGEGILTPIQTEALMNLAPMLDSLQNMFGASNFDVYHNIPEIMRNEKPNVTLHYDKMFEFNGDFNSSEQLLNQMKNVASKVTTKVLNDINRDYKVRH